MWFSLFPSINSSDFSGGVANFSWDPDPDALWKFHNKTSLIILKIQESKSSRNLTQKQSGDGEKLKSKISSEWVFLSTGGAASLNLSREEKERGF